MKKMKINSSIKVKFLPIILVFSVLLFAHLFTMSVSAQEEQKKETAGQEDTLAPETGEDAESQTTSVEEGEAGQFVYRPGGRRDPFWNLMLGKSVKVKREAREGIGGMLIDELVLEGILKTDEKYIALFKGPDGRPYDVKVGDSVYDGEVIKIDGNNVVFKRILTIALGGTKEKIITISLIPEEEASKK
jgi:hypothetical protein